MKYSIIIIFSLLLFGNSIGQNKWQISIGGGVISPAFLIVAPLGYQIEGRIFYSISDSLQLSISTGFNKWEEPVGFGDNKFKSIPLLFGVKYSIRIGSFAPYFTGDLGVQFINRSYILQTYEPSPNFPDLYRLVSSTPESESVVKFAFRFGIGSTLSINKDLDLDFAIKYNSISYDYIYIFNPSNQISSGHLDFYSFFLGFNYKI